MSAGPIQALLLPGSTTRLREEPQQQAVKLVGALVHGLVANAAQPDELSIGNPGGGQLAFAGRDGRIACADNHEGWRANPVETVGKVEINHGAKGADSGLWRSVGEVLGVAAKRSAGDMG